MRLVLAHHSQGEDVPSHLALSTFSHVGETRQHVEAAVSLAVGTDINSTSILSLSAPWTSLWWECKSTFDNPNIGNSHFEHFQEKLREKVLPELGLQERVCWGLNVYSLSGPPTPWYQKNAALFLNFTFHLTNARGCGFAFWSYTDNWGCQCGISLTPLLPLRPPYPEQHPCSTSVHTGPAER